MHLDLMRDKECVMPVIDDPDAIHSLRIWHCKYVTLEPVGALRHLKTLVIATFPDTSLS